MEVIFCELPKFSIGKLFNTDISETNSLYLDLLELKNQFGNILKAAEIVDLAWFKKTQQTRSASIFIATRLTKVSSRTSGS